MEIGRKDRILISKAVVTDFWINSKMSILGASSLVVPTGDAEWR